MSEKNKITNQSNVSERELPTAINEEQLTDTTCDFVDGQSDDSIAAHTSCDVDDQTHYNGATDQHCDNIKVLFSNSTKKQPYININGKSYRYAEEYSKRAEQLGDTVGMKLIPVDCGGYVLYIDEEHLDGIDDMIKAADEQYQRTLFEMMHGGRK